MLRQRDNQTIGKLKKQLSIVVNNFHTEKEIIDIVKELMQYNTLVLEITCNLEEATQIHCGTFQTFIINLNIFKSTKGAGEGLKALYSQHNYTTREQILFSLFHEFGHFLDMNSRSQIEYLGYRAEYISNLATYKNHRDISQEQLADKYAIERVAQIARK